MENKNPHPAEMAQGAPMTDLARFAKEQLAALEKTYGVQFDRLSQIAAEPGGERVLALWKAGADLADAWAAVNLEKVLSKKQTALKQAVLNSVYGKQHLVPAGGGARQEAEVPEDVYEQYRALVPGMTRSQICADWRRYNEN